MNNRTVLLICVALVLGGAYYRFFMDGHKKPGIQIFCEKPRANIMGNNTTPTIRFHFPVAYDLTSVEVVDADDARTNKYPHPLWHLIAPDKPAKTTSFLYGETIPGMKPEIATAVPDPLEQGGEYTLIVEAGKKLKGTINFKPF